MPNDQSSSRLPEEALAAFLEGLLKELRNPPDADALSKVRAAFRRRIPLLHRSDAAALLILRAAGLSRGTAGAPERIEPKSPDAKSAQQRTSAGRFAATRKPGAEKPGADRSGAARSGQGQPGARQEPRAERAKAPSPARRSRAESTEPAGGRVSLQDRHSPKSPVRIGEPRGSDRQHDRPAAERPAPEGPSGPVAPLFVSMGRRQRLKPAELRALIEEKTGIPAATLGRVRLFDNYCFIDIAETEAERVVAAMDGIELRGRKLEVKPAKRRGEQDEAAAAGDTVAEGGAAETPESPVSPETDE